MEAVENSSGKTLVSPLPSSRVFESPPKQTKTKQYASRISEARTCLIKAKTHLGSTKNLSTAIREAVTKELDRLYHIVKEAEAERERGITAGKSIVAKAADLAVADTAPVKSTDQTLIAVHLKEQSRLLQEHGRKMEELKEAVNRQNQMLERSIAVGSYAAVTTTPKNKALIQRNTLHSIVVASGDETETSEEVLEKVRSAVDAKEGWIQVERIRKTKDRKIIMGFKSKEERDRASDRLKKDENSLNVEAVKNKDPLLILWGVLKVHSDEDIERALRNQNRDVFHGLDKEDDRMEVRYRRRARNPLTAHVVIRVSPTIWRRAIDRGSVHIDLQISRVEDQTPLIQCTRCLGFGHGKRHCVEAEDVCSHCGGPHHRAECVDWLAGVPPRCRNCTKAKNTKVEHNAFSRDCPVRHKWDDLARSSVAYC